MPELARCPAAPAGESHRWRIPDQGTPGPARCRHCAAERTFQPWDDTTLWETAGERTADRHGAALLGSRPSRRVW